jgi:hypothetical protein
VNFSPVFAVPSAGGSTFTGPPPSMSRAHWAMSKWWAPMSARPPPIVPTPMKPSAMRSLAPTFGSSARSAVRTVGPASPAAAADFKK